MGYLGSFAYAALALPSEQDPCRVSTLDPCACDGGFKIFQILGKVATLKAEVPENSFAVVAPKPRASGPTRSLENCVLTPRALPEVRTVYRGT